MIQFPISHIKKNMVMTKDDEVWAYYRIQENTVGINEDEALENFLYRLEKLSWQLSAFQEIDYKILPVPIDIHERMERLKGQYEGRYEEIGRYYADRTADILSEQAKNSVEYKFFVGIKLEKKEFDNEGVISSVMTSLKSMNRYVQRMAGVDGKGIDELTLAGFIDSEEDAFSLVSSYFYTVRANEQNLRYLIRHQYVRGQEKQEMDESLHSLTQGVLDQSQVGYLRIEQLEDASYAAFLPVVEFPVDLTHKEWTYLLQNLDFPAEIHMRTIYKSKKDDYNETNKIKKRFRDQDTQLLEANEDEDSLINKGRHLLHELENDIKNQNKPLLWTHVHLVVSAGSKEECRRRIVKLKSEFKDRGIEIVQPLADQLTLFHQSIPGAKIIADDWEQILTPESFAESLFSLTRKIGNTVGFYLGKNISEIGEVAQNSPHVVFYHPFLAQLGLKGSKYSSPHVTISGPTGMGKSYLLKDILLNAIFFGAKILMTDPKNEVEKKFKTAVAPEIERQVPYFKELVESFNYITFSPDRRDAGKLDPLTFLEGEEAHDTAVAILEYLSELQSTERNIKTAIYKSVRHILTTEKKPGLLKVVQDLQGSQDIQVRNVGDLLHEIGTNGVAKLMFSDGNVSGISLREQVNILQIQNLTLPEDGEKPATRDEHIAVALMIPLAKFATQFARNDSETKITIFEEAWMLTNTGQGHKLIKEMLRTGRSLRSAVYIITQSTVDFNRADIKEGIGTKFAFKAKTAEEASNIIEFLGLEDSKGNRELLKNLSEGQCVMEDIYGRTAKIGIDVPFNEWVEAFNTKEEDKGRSETEEAFI
jgi:AAA-like domain